MKFIPVKTRILHPPKDSIYPLLDTDLPPLQETDIVLITSKILAIHQGRCVKIEGGPKKSALIKKEAKPGKPLRVICKGTPQGYMYLTIKNHALVPTSGIDESNANGYYILWPKEVNRLAQELCEYLKKKNNIKKLAIIATDSHTIPLRHGVIGFAIGFYGLYPLRDYRGKKDIFGRELKITQTNIVDALAAGGVLAMGEGRETTPVTIARGVECVKFTVKNTYKQLVISRRKDLYAPLLRAFDQK